MQPLQRWPGYERIAPSRQSVARPFRNRTGSHRLRTEHRPPGCQRVLVLSAGYGKSLIATTAFVPITQSGSACLYRGTAKIMGARSLAGKPLAGFRATPSRRIIVLCDMIVSVIRFKNPLLHRQSSLRKRRLGENRGFRPSF